MRYAALFTLGAMLFAQGCAGGSNAIPVGVQTPQPPPQYRPGWLYLQFVDKTNVTLWPSPWKQRDCWPMPNDPYPIPAGIPAKDYYIDPIAYIAKRCGKVSQHDFTITYGKEYPPLGGCTLSIAYDANRKPPYAFDLKGGEGLTCRIHRWKNDGKPPVTITAIDIFDAK